MGMQESFSGISDNLSTEGKTRIVQELVPGKQITIAHLIANPDKVLYEKLGLIRAWIIPGRLLGC